ncbi:MAG TPA: MerR family transcriptional regulator [Polyangiaceae bacterium]|nr:MerR family transcriptional regulator [Polyangiaceae bacterium]
MAGDTELPVKLYYRIGEVAQIVGVEPHVLRYWEGEFRSIRPQKSRKGQRVYSRRDVEKLLKVKELLYTHGFTIAGARRRLREGGPDLSPGSEPSEGSAQPAQLAADSPALDHARDAQELTRERSAVVDAGHDEVAPFALSQLLAGNMAGSRVANASPAPAARAVIQLEGAPENRIGAEGTQAHSGIEAAQPGVAPAQPGVEASRDPRRIPVERDGRPDALPLHARAELCALREQVRAMLAELSFSSRR